MFTRWLPCLPLFVLLAAPAPAVVAQPKPDQPTLVVRVRSLDSAFEFVRLVVNPLLKKDVGGEFEALIKAKAGPDALKGVDPKRPIGLYGKVGKDITELSGVVLVPVGDEKAFLTMLDNLGFKHEKDKDGLFTVKQNALPVDLFFRFAHEYAYVTALNAEALDRKSLVPPEQIFTRQSAAFLSATLRLEQVPDGVKQMILQQIDEVLGAKIEKEAGESKAQHGFRVALIREVSKQLTAALRDGKELSFDLDVNKQSNTLSADVTLTPLPNTELAKTVAGLGGTQSLFAGVMHKDAALNVLVHLNLPDKLREALAAVVDEAGKKAVEETKDDGKKGQVQKLLDALLPSLTAGEVDLGLSLRGPSLEKTYTLVAGFKLREVEKVTATLIELLKDLPAAEKDLIKLNVDKADGVAIHQLNAQKTFDAKTKAMFGEHPIYLAFRKDAVFVTLGDEGLKAIKEAVAVAPAAGAPLQFEVSLSRMAQLLAKTDDEKKNVGKLLGQGKADRLRVTVEGGATLRVHLETHLSVLETLMHLGAVPELPADPKKDKDKEK